MNHIKKTFFEVFPLIKNRDKEMKGRKLRDLFSLLPISLLLITLACGETITVEPPTFNLEEGTVYYGTQSLIITTTTSDATIYYTIDDTEATTSSAEYSSRLILADIGGGEKTIRTIAVKDGTSSGETRATFTIMADIDVDDDGLIEIYDLDILNNMRYNLAGTSYKISVSHTGITTGASTTLPANCMDRPAPNNLCGYELMQSLDFTNAGHYASGRVNGDWIPNNSDPDMASNPGFNGLGAVIGFRINGFTGVFEGNGHTINNFYSRNTRRREGTNVGLFKLVNLGGMIRNVGLSNANVYGGDGNTDYVGGLAGRNFRGTIMASYATGNADGGVGNADYVGILLGDNRGTITASYATGNADGGAGNTDRVGGLVGLNRGTITASHATGNADGGTGNADRVGGLVGWSDGGTTIASYATGGSNGGAGNADYVGGLVGLNDDDSAITASYATGEANGGDGDRDRVGGLVGWNNDNSTIIASYATGGSNGGAGASDYVGGLVGLNNELSTITASYATGDSNGGDGDDDRVGGLVGEEATGDRGGTTTASYAFGMVTGEMAGSDGTMNLVGVTSAAALTAANAGVDSATPPNQIWNSATDNTMDAWNFGDATQAPALVYADYDGSGASHASCNANNGGFPAAVPGTEVVLTCGTTLVNGQRP